MTDPKVTSITPATPVTETSDGRRLRSGRSRQQLINALFALIKSGDVSPSAAQIAEKAGVGLRTVFRHFDDVDSLYGEMAEQMMAENFPSLMAPYEQSDWRGRINELTSRRATLYESIFWVRIAASLRRYQSRYLMEDYRRHAILGRTSLQAIVPKSVFEDKILFAALEVALSFQSWRRLRQDQGLNPQDAQKVTALTVARLIEGVNA